MDIQITFRGFDPSDAVRTYVEMRAAKVLAHYRSMIALKVALEAPHHHHTHGHEYRVRIECIVPGADIVISPRDSAKGHTDLHAAIDDAFADADRRLRDHAQIQRGDVKTHVRD